MHQKMSCSAVLVELSVMGLFRVPTTYDDGKVTAAYNDGLLRITIGKRPDESFHATSVLEQVPKRNTRKSACD